MTGKKLTAAFLRASRVIFRPENESQAIGIQNWMYRHGIYWKDGQSTIWDPLKCVERHMVVEQGILFVKPDLDVPYTVGHATQLDGWDEDDCLGDIQRLEKKIDRLQGQLGDMQAQLAQVLSRFEPPVAARALVVRKPAGGAAP